MSDSFIQAPPDSSGKLIDTEELTVGTNTVQRQRVNVMNFWPPPIITPGSTQGGTLAPAAYTTLAAGSGSQVAAVGFLALCNESPTLQASATVTDGTGYTYAQFTLAPGASLTLQFNWLLQGAAGQSLTLTNTSTTASIDFCAIATTLTP